jgi:UDP-N-acetylmuramoyl-tripeptide--D-alanyl-D-alanine ligase
VIRMSLSQVAAALDGRLLGGDASFTAVSTDSRHLAPGELFVALTGPRFDGNDYVGQAAVHGAVAAVVSRPVDVAMPCLLVPDTRIALGRLAASWRAACPARVVAVTGSNGKTTLKEMIAAILRERGPVLSTVGNLNNDVGVPLTLLRLQDEPYAVIEMGANHLGEIRYLSELARPDVAVLNNAGRAHLEGFGTEENIARGKAEIVTGLQPRGTFVYNADSSWAPLWRDLAAGRNCLTFGIGAAADVTSPGSARLDWTDRGFRNRFTLRAGEGTVEAELALAGAHNRSNALAAAAAALAVGCTLEQIRDGLARVEPIRGRLEPLHRGDGAWVIDDSYNANPDSVAAAIAVLGAAAGRKLLVLGDLAELGPETAALHARIGTQARSAGLDALYTVGAASEAASRSFGTGASHFADQPALIDALRRVVGAGDVVLVKGSRSAGMEKVVAALTLEESARC